MRIAVVNWSSRRVGGTETYLSNIVPELARLATGRVLLRDGQAGGRELITLPEGTPTWCASELGSHRALAALREWRPDLIYSHGIPRPRLELKTLQVAPAVFFAHTYHGTCISGAKTFKRPVGQPCDRASAGSACCYYPHRCGGLSPLTMSKLFRTQSEASGGGEGVRGRHHPPRPHMRAEYLNHGLRPERGLQPLNYRTGVRLPGSESRPAPSLDRAGVRH